MRETVMGYCTAKLVHTMKEVSDWAGGCNAKLPDPCFFV